MSDVPIRGKSTQVSLPLWVGVTFLLLGMATLWWRRYRRLPRWMGPPLFLLVHGGLPWALSLLTRRHGWSGRGPSTWNLLRLPLVGVGGASAIWGFALHLVESPEGLEWAQVQKFLLRRGPYAVSRNPMYLGELLLWLGWALFYGSVAVFLCFCLWGAAFRFLIVPREEPRWRRDSARPIGRTRRGSRAGSAYPGARGRARSPCSSRPMAGPTAKTR